MSIAGRRPHRLGGRKPDGGRVVAGAGRQRHGGGQIDEPGRRLRSRAVACSQNSTGRARPIALNRLRWWR
jgi:hypothetical protein